MLRIHTVVIGDTVAELALKNGVSVSDIVNANPTLFDADRIEQQEQYILEKKLVEDGILIFPGDEIFIPVGRGIKEKQKQKLKKESVDDYFQMLADGKKLINPVGFELAQHYDACSDSISFSYPIEADEINFDLENFKTGLPEIEVYKNSKLVFSGQVEKKRLSINSNSMSSVFSGRSSTRLLEKSDVMPKTQTTFKNMTFSDIAEKILSPFGINFIFDDSVDDEILETVFEKVERSDGEKPFLFLSRLAKDLKLKIGSDVDGIIFKKFEIKPAVASFVVNSEFLEFLGVDSIDIDYDTTNLHGSYVGKLQDSKNDNISKSIKSNYINELSIKTKSFQNIKETQLSDALAWDEQKTILNFYNTTIPYPSWTIPDSDKDWECGDCISLTINEKTKKSITLMIKDIIFKLDGDGVEVAELSLIPAETYV